MTDTQATEHTERIGADTEFAATLTVTPMNEEATWVGSILFDNPAFNWQSPYEGEEYAGIDPALIARLTSWDYLRAVASGAYMMSLLTTWHGDIVKLFERVRAAGEGK